MTNWCVGFCRLRSLSLRVNTYAACGIERNKAEFKGVWGRILQTREENSAKFELCGNPYKDFRLSVQPQEEGANMFTVEQIRQRSKDAHRVMISPKVKVEAKTPDQKREVSRVAKQVIQQHYAVLSALKDR